MTVWHWVRHGPTHETSFVGWRDVPADLSDVESIARLRGHLPDRAVLLSSDLMRASATADSIEQDGHTRLPHDPRLREMNLGLWDGMRFDDVAAGYPDLSRRFWEQPGDVHPPEGESWNVTAARVNETVDDLNTRYPDSHVIAVAHIGVILTQIQRAMAIEATAALAHGIDNLSVTTIVWRQGVAAVERINHIP